MTGITLRPTTRADLDWVLELEHAPRNEAFITRWPRESHVRVMAEEGARHFIIEDEAGRRAGYLILRGVRDPSGSIELLRIAVENPGAGIGRKALRHVMRLAFDVYGAHRLWLDVRATNLRAHHLYRREGFVEEGVLREAARRPDGYDSLILMSMLEHEYERLPWRYTEG